MVLTVPVLHQTTFANRVVAARSRRVQANGGGHNLVDFTGAFPEVLRQGTPVGLGQTAQKDAQAVIGKIYSTEGLSAQGLERMLMISCPILDADFAVIGLRQDKGHPDGGEPTVGQTLMQVMAAEMSLQQLW